MDDDYVVSSVLEFPVHGLLNLRGAQVTNFWGEIFGEVVMRSQYVCRQLTVFLSHAMSHGESF